MRLLFLSQGRKPEDHPGSHGAFLQLKEEGVLSEYENMPYFGFSDEHGWDSFFNEVVRKVQYGKFDVVFFQCFHHPDIPDPTRCVLGLKSMPDTPLIITSVGDPYSADWRPPYYPCSFKKISGLADITFSTQMGEAAWKMKQWGAKNIVLLPHASCQVRFPSSPLGRADCNPEFDVVFIGSFLRSRNPLSHYYQACRQRFKAVKILDQRYGNRFGLFGRGWDGLRSWQGAVPFSEQLDICRRGRLVFGGVPHSVCDYYMSDRPFFAIGSGVPFVDMAVPRVDKILRDTEHFYKVGSIDHLLSCCDRLLDMDSSTLYLKAHEASRYVHETHTLYHRMKFVLETAAIGLENRKSGVPIPKPKLPFFLPEVNAEEESAFAVVNWQG